jgi:hypothetical protein
VTTPLQTLTTSPPNLETFHETPKNRPQIFPTFLSTIFHRFSIIMLIFMTLVNAKISQLKGNKSHALTEKS